MTSTPEAARRRLRKLATDRRQASRVETEAIVTALRLGVRQADVARDIERSREHVRLIAREAGIQSTRTVRLTDAPESPHTPR